jgi:hypothetical protein
MEFIGGRLIEMNIFWSLINLWPLILVVIGVNMIFKDNAWIKALAWILLIAAMVAYSYYGGADFRFLGIQFKGNDLTAATAQHQLHDKMEYGQLNLKLGAGDVTIGSTGEYAIYSQYPEEITENESDFDLETQTFAYTAKHDEGYLPMPRRNTNGYTYLYNLSEELLWDIDIDMGAMDMDMDLRDVPFDRLDMDLGAGDVTCYFGILDDAAYVSIDSGVSDVTLYVPEEMPMRLHFEGGIKDIDFEGAAALRKNGEYYETKEFNQGLVHYEIDVNTGVGELTINRY